MKKLYRKGTVHPSPPIITDRLSLLPAAIFTLAGALSPEDREVLAYLLSGHRSKSKSKTAQAQTQKPSFTKTWSDHPTLFNCDCFRCYTSYWVRWDSSLNRQLIHEIIDAYEEGLAQNKISKNNRKERNKKCNHRSRSDELKGSSELSSEKGERRELSLTSRESFNGGEEDELEKGSSVRMILNFIGEKIWGSST